MKAYSSQTLEEYEVHFDTSNVSFLKMALTLRKMGIKNWYFHLKLYNKNLANINPYDPNLTAEEKAQVWKECETNRWYYYREVFRVGETGSATGIGGGTCFKLNRGNMAYLWATDLNLSTYMILPRQTGKTWAAIANASWIHQFRRNSTILHFNKNQQDASDNLGRIKMAIGMLPNYLQHSNPDNMTAASKRLISNNVKSIRNRFNSTITTMSSAGNEAKADAMARGKTAEVVWYDEFAFIFFNEAIYTAATPAFETASENAIKNQAPYGISITTTPGDLASPHGAFAFQMMEKCVPFTEDVYDMPLNKLHKMIYETSDKDDHVPFLFIQYNYRQLGKTDEWYRQRYAKMANPLKARREYLLEWIDTNGNSPFDPDDVETIGEYARSREITSKTERISKFYTLKIYSKYKGRKPVIISCDVSGSIGRDACTAVVINPETLEPIAIFKSNTVTTKHFQKIIVKLATKYYPHSIITIENNSIGNPLIEALKDTPIRNKIYREKKKRQFDMGATSFTKKRVRDTIEWGHNTNTTTRPQMMDILESMVRHSPQHLGYMELYDEVRFMQLKNGRIDHGNASHDDVTMAYLGGLWIIRYGKGLKGKGIYWNISDGSSIEDDVTFEPDIKTVQMVDNIVKKKRKSSVEDEVMNKLIGDQSVMTSSDFADMERAAYLKARDRTEGIVDEFDEEGGSDEFDMIDPKLEKLLLKHYPVGIANTPFTYDSDNAESSSWFQPSSEEKKESVFSFYEGFN